jgi:hypothetical protein
VSETSRDCLGGVVDRLRTGKAWNRGGFQARSSGFPLLRQIGPSLAPTQPLYEWVHGFSPSEIRRQGREPDNSPTPCADVKVQCGYGSAFPYVSSRAQGQLYI